MHTRSDGLNQSARRLDRKRRTRLLVAVVGVALLAATSSVTLTAGDAATSTDPVALPAPVVEALTGAAAACPALTPGRLAGQVMATTRFVATPEGGIGGLSAAQWETWKPTPDALPDSATMSLLALAHLTCDLVGQVRFAGVAGNPWRLAVAALRSSVADVRSAAGVPNAVAPFVSEVETHAAWYTVRLGGPRLTATASTASAAATTPVPTASPSQSPSPSLSRTTTPASPGPAPTSFGPALIVDRPRFADASGLRLNGSAKVTDGRLDLTSGSQQAGSAWLTTTIDPSLSFSTSFTVAISGPTDGLAFVLQGEGPGAVGAPGGSIGYGSGPADPEWNRIRPSVAVELDTWDNSPDGFDPAGHQHIAVTQHGDITRHLVWRDPGFDMAANRPVTVWVTYDAAGHKLSVSAAQSSTRPASPLFTFGIDLRSVLLGNDRVRVGFTGGTGLTSYASPRESVLSWTAA